MTTEQRDALTRELNWAMAEAERFPGAGTFAGAKVIEMADGSGDWAVTTSVQKVESL